MNPFDSDLSKRVLTILGDHFVEELLDRVAGRTELAPLDQERASRYTKVKVEGLHSLATTLDDPEDAEELHESLVTMWLELRSEWARYNKTVNYRRLIHDEEDVLSSVLGAICSNLLKAIEPLIPNELHRLTDFASAPVPAISRSGRFARSNVDDRAVSAEALDGIAATLSNVAQTIPARGSGPADLDELKREIESCAQRLQRMLQEPAVSTEVARVAIEECLLRFGEEHALPLAPRIRIAGVERLDAHTVARLIESTRSVFEALRSGLTTDQGPVRSQTDFTVSDDAIKAIVSVLPSFLTDMEHPSTKLDGLQAEGVEYSLDAEQGLSLKYELPRAE